MIYRNHILCVDDDKFVRYILEHSLESEFDLTICEDGFQALKWFEENHQPDVIITDLNMPLLGGKDLIKRIRSFSRGQHIPIIVLSSTDDSSVRIECIELGVDDFVIKPFNPNELKARVKAQIRRLNQDNQTYNRELQLLNSLHLREWNENLSLEIKDRQCVDQRHKQECDRLHLVEINFHERDLLKIQHLQELQKLTSQNSKIRIAIKQRQAREIVTLKSNKSY